MCMYKMGADRNQMVICPPSLEDMIPANHIVRVIDAFVDGLDMVVLGFRKSITAGIGQHPYDPKDLYKLHLYGYINRIRASRRLAKECKRNIEVMWLLRGLTPDFRTIADFRAFNTAALVRAFRLFVQILREMKLLGSEFTVDGTKIRANNSIKKSFTKEVTGKKLSHIEEQIRNYEREYEAYLTDAEKCDREKEKKALEIAIGISPKEIPAKLKALRERAKKYRGYMKRFDAGEKQILETDPDCRTLHSKDGLHPAYNPQTVVETRNHFITNFNLTNANTDQNQLSVTGEIVKQELHREVVHLIADKGYESREDIEKCLMNGIIPNVGFKYDKDERVFNPEYREAEITEEIRQSTKPEAIQTCLHAGVLPKCYEGTNISVEVQNQNLLSCFIRHEDGHVTCPMGRELFYHSDKPMGKVYGSKEACRTCPNRCTDGRNEKRVQFGPCTNCVPVLLYGDPRFPVQQIPPNARISPNNHTLDRKDNAAKKVRLTIARDIPRQKLRMQVAEHPFGTVKWYDGYHHYLLRGKEKVAAETALAFLSYNIRRAVNLTTPKDGGAPGILMFLRSKKWEKVIG